MSAYQRPSWFSAVLVDLAYLLLSILAWPVLLVLLLTRRKWREGFWERMGCVPRLPRHPMRLWVHAISVGETEAARSFIPALRKRFSEAEIVFSTTTRTGRRRAQSLFPDLTVFHFPLDLPWATAAALGRIRPAAIVQVEAEWWPNFMVRAARRGIPVAMVNVRITEKGQRGYRRIAPMFRLMAAVPRAIGVQNETYGRRLTDLGVPPDRITVTGQMKFDNVRTKMPEGVPQLRRELGLDDGDTLLVAGSTGPGEEPLLLDAYLRLKADHPHLRLAVVPRKPERFEEVAHTISERGLALIRRSETKTAPASHDPQAVILGDTMGELMTFYGAAALVFVGRSLVPMGGSNPIEPAGLALPMVFGPHMFNFPEGDELFLAGEAARQAADVESLCRTLDQLLQSPDEAAAMGRRAQQLIRQAQGAAARNVELVAAMIRDAAGDPS